MTGTAGLKFPRFWQAVGWFGVAVVVYLTLMPKPPPMPGFFLSWDKAQHFIAYAGLMWWFRQAFEPQWRWVVFLTILGIALEGIQGVTDTRHFSYGDMVANAIGVFGGVVLVAMTPLGRVLAWVDRLLGKIFS